MRIYRTIILTAAVCCLILSVGCNQNEIDLPPTPNFDIIPKPQEIRFSEGYFLVGNATILQTPEMFSSEAQEFSDFCSSYLQVELSSVSDQSTENLIELLFVSDSLLSGEMYQISVDSKKISVRSSTNAGITHGLSTLKQLAFLNKHLDHYFIPALTIVDHPEFSHRGLLLDCCRHFFSKEVVLKYIDLLSFYKMNVFHWHLTEDQGWRIQIDKYPRLTEIAAWRNDTNGNQYGGFYTKDDIREVVAYATKKHITVIPEIELPGHSQAAIAAYPHLSCTGNSIAVANDWGVFKDIYCAGNDSSYIFLEDVLTEVMDLFPSTYIHIGGDEAPKTRWEACTKCNKKMHDEHLKDAHELQSYFIKRIQSFLSEHGRAIIGWDEIIEGGLAAGAVVQSWRGMDGGVEAVKHGNEAIMSPTSHAYFDYNLDAIDLEKVYSFYPVPNALNAEETALIKGGECNMWTEHVPDESTLDSKVFPRLLAMAEVLWSDSAGRSFNEFRSRVSNHHEVLKKYNVNAGLETVPVAFNASIVNNTIKVTLEQRIDDIEVECAINNGKFEPYLRPLEFESSQKHELRIVTKRNKIKLGEEMMFSVYPHKGINHSLKYVDKAYSDWYSGGGDGALLDGVLGTSNFRDGHWQGFWGNDLDCIVDLDSLVSGVSSVEANFYQYNNAWIFIPKQLSVSISRDGMQWLDMGELRSQVNPKKRGKFISTLKIDKNFPEFRYLRLYVSNFGTVPEWHEAAGSDAWIFIDEIIIK